MVDPRVAQVVANVFRLDVSRITPELGIGAIDKWDSLGHLQLVMKLEEAFKVRFGTKTIPLLTSVDKIENHLRAQGALAR